MNHFYRVVFNRRLSVWQAVSETAKARGKGGKPVKAVAVALLSLGTVHMPVAAQDITWIGGPGNDWGTSTNWDNGVPTVSDSVFISSDNPQVNQLVINTDSISLGSLTLGQTDGGPVDVTLSAGTAYSVAFDVDALSIANGSTLRIGSAGHTGMLTLSAGEGWAGDTSDFTLSVEHGTFRLSESGAIDSLTNGVGSTLNVGANGTYDLNGSVGGHIAVTRKLTGSGHILNNGSEDGQLQVIDDSQFDGVIQDGGKKTSLVTFGHLTLTGDNTYTGGSTIGNGGALQIGNGGTTGAIAGHVIGDGTLVFNRSNTYLFGGDISGTNKLVQAGTGKTILTGNNIHTGSTQINQGTLQVDGSLLHSDIDVSATGRLQGVGTVGSAVVSGTVAPGSEAIGTLNVAGNITFNHGSVYQVKVDASGRQTASR